MIPTSPRVPRVAPKPTKENPWLTAHLPGGAPTATATPPTVYPGGAPTATAALTGNELHDAVRHTVGRMPGALSPLEQAQQAVAAELDPLYKQLQTGYNSQAVAGAQAIQALTKQYADQLGLMPAQINSIYGGAEQSTAASNAALADRLSGAGQQSSDDLAARLASIQQPGAVNPAVAGVAQQATGAGNALYGTGNASLDQLIQQAASAQGYAAKLPGIAKLTGLQQLGQFKSALTTAEGKDIAALQDKAPGLIQSAFGTLTSANNAQAARDQSARQFNATQAGNRFDRRLKAYEFGVTTRQTAAWRKAQNQLAGNKQGLAALALADKIGKNPDGSLNTEGQAIFQTLGIPYKPGTVIGNPPTIKTPTLNTTASGTAGYEVGNDGKPILDTTGNTIPYTKTGSGPSPSLSAKLGYVVDGNGNAIADKDGNVQILPGFQVNAAGTGVEKIPKPVKPPAVKTPHLSSAASAKFGYEVDTTGQPILRGGKRVPYPKSGSGAGTAGAKTSAIKSANSTVLSIISKGARPLKTSTTDPVTGVKTAKVVRPRVGSSAYYQAIHEAEVAIAPLVSSYMTPVQITQFVQAKANAYFAKGK